MNQRASNGASAEEAPPVFVARDFRDIALRDLLNEVRKEPDFRWDIPELTEDKPGTIWEGVVKQGIENCEIFAAFMDAPNINVALEVGYALGHPHVQRVKLLTHINDPKDWLTKHQPFREVGVKKVDSIKSLIDKLKTESGLDTLPPSSEAAGGRSLVLCPRTIGSAYLNAVEKFLEEGFAFDQLTNLDGLQLSSLPQQCEGVDLLIWVLPLKNADQPRDGYDNTGMAFVAGLAMAFGIEVKVFVCNKPGERPYADLAPIAKYFDGTDQLRNNVERQLREAEKRRQQVSVPTPVAPLQLPESFKQIDQPPAIDELQRVERGFFGREDLLGTLRDAIEGLIARHLAQPLKAASQKRQAFWFYGIGGMGKSWLLRRAILMLQEELSVRPQLLLVDWDDKDLRKPTASRHPDEALPLFDPLALRLLQTRGGEIQSLQHYLQSRSTFGQMRDLHNRYHARFFAELQDLLDGKATMFTNMLWRTICNDPVCPQQTDRRQEYLEDLAADAERTEELFASWMKDQPLGRAGYDDVVDYQGIAVGALGDDLRSAADQQPLIIMVDTCELVAQRWIELYRRLIQATGDQTPSSSILWIFASRFPPGRRDRVANERWTSDLGSEYFQSVDFEHGHFFRTEEIEHALKQLKRPVDGDLHRLADRLKKTTHGQPYAVRCYLDLHEDEESVLEDLAAAADVEPQNASDVARKVSERFLKHFA